MSEYRERPPTNTRAANAPVADANPIQVGDFLDVIFFGMQQRNHQLANQPQLNGHQFGANGMQENQGEAPPPPPPPPPAMQ